MIISTATDNNAQTRERLLEAAGEVFAEKGYRQATVREICRRAGANVAAVNYHFRDKEHLYAQVLQHAYDRAVKKYPPMEGVEPNATAERRLHAFVRSFLLRVFDRGQPAWHGKLMAREIAEPTAAFDAVVEQSVRPMFSLLTAITAELLGTAADPTTVRLCSSSVVGQVLHYHYGRSVIGRLYPDVAWTPEEIDRLADHITRFSAAAMRAFACGEGGA